MNVNDRYQQQEINFKVIIIIIIIIMIGDIKVSQ